ncbi:MAG TPA: hypothetical protein VF941_07270 [Clostridia bacterium]
MENEIKVASLKDGDIIFIKMNRMCSFGDRNKIKEEYEEFFNACGFKVSCFVVDSGMDIEIIRKV